MNATENGLTTASARERLRTDGPNALPAADHSGILGIAAGVLREPMFLLLCAAASVYVVLGDLREGLVLAASILVVLTITIVQERRTERALEALRDLSSPRARVIRDGIEQRIPGIEVVRGDLVVLGEGDRVPADARLVEVGDLQIDESLLTGESMPVEKSVDKEPLVYSGTLVVKGRGRAAVVATGPATELGKIGGVLHCLEPERTPLQVETGRAVRVFGALALVMCLAIAATDFALRGGWLQALLSGLTLAMAIIPEEFPVVLTVFLALGAWRISRHGVLTRRMPAVETLGAATVLCVDKTGTLTENRMTVAEIFVNGRWHRPTEVGAEGAPLLFAAALACDPDPFDPMERAILEAAASTPGVVEWRTNAELERTYPLSGAFLAVCHARHLAGERRIAIKGAPEIVLSLCGLDVAAALEEARQAALRGLRILAVASARWHGAEYPMTPAGFHFTWLGFVALADPLRSSVPGAVEQCRRAGIRVVMITGDYPATALAIARTAGIATAAGAVTGAELAAMSEAQRAEAVKRVSVFARVVPEQKLHLVNAYKTAGEVVAMTGDGVNDAPALRAAHIGIAMGRRGTDVAREAAALVLQEDDFAAIVETVRLGRRIYENIRNAMRYLISVHVPIAGMAFLPLLFGWPLLLYPVHVVFLEFAIDPACSIAFEAEKTEADSMARPPRDPDAPLFSLALLTTSLATGAAMLVAVVAAYGWGLHRGLPPEEARALGFASLIFGNVALILAVRSNAKSFLGRLTSPNRALWWIVGGTIAALVAVLYVEPLAKIFKLAPLGAAELAVAVVAGAVAIFAVEALKRLRATQIA